MEEHKPYTPPSRDAEVTLADIIRTVQGYLRYLARGWYWMLGVAILGMGIAFAIVKSHTIEHIAEITFVANQESQRGGNSILASTLASFGLSGGKEGESGQYTKILALSQSRKIQFSALLDTVEVDNQRDLMINHISRVYDLQKTWEVEEPIHFTFQSPDSMDLTNRQYLKRIYSMINNDKQPMYSVSLDNASQMITMKAETIHPELSIALVYALYENLSQFYVLQSTAKGIETVSTLSERKDSLENVLQKQQASLASAIDRSRGMTYRSQQTNRLDLTVDLEITRTMYMEVVKNLEMSRFNLENIRPIFTIIDYPLQPLPTNRKSLIRLMVIFAIVGSVFAGMILILRKMYVDVMREEKG
ncbi:hypothetical protein KUV50_00690 [Membranicola marinus]|uniref:Chain length determinant protein n=1 Tax=Membranihabitans marinus TaxID=1227546 RepID=A0A953HQP6_9BACT|nr:hypothetical protein [Membranihabitans marinus]MBY5956630.1 hypothetical protein [Membranihabitans marinus]